jgi:predicted MFS family arabinose efflux permease
MLLPFILLEWPTGEIADRFFGEKEIMGIGFVFTIGALVFMPFIGKVFSLWMLILLLSRVGASLIEITTESYFFKQVDASDTALMSIYRLARPAGIILGSLVGALSLSLLSFDKIFFVAALVVLVGLRESLLIEDTL